MWAIDGGLEYSGLAINGQYFMRWLNDFVADGPIPVTSTFDHGYELSAGYFVIPKKLLLYGRGSQVFGQFGNSYEYAGGVKWHFLPTERLWLNTELMRFNKAPVAARFTLYTAGMNGGCRWSRRSSLLTNRHFSDSRLIAFTYLSRVQKSRSRKMKLLT
jgi:hypothetical protein